MSDTPHSEQEIRAIAQEVAREVVRELLDGPGVTVEDLVYLRRQREGSQQLAAWIRKGAVMAAVSGSLWALWEGLKAGIR